MQRLINFSGEVIRRSYHYFFDRVCMPIVFSLNKFSHFTHVQSKLSEMVFEFQFNFVWFLFLSWLILQNFLFKVILGVLKYGVYDFNPIFRFQTFLYCYFQISLQLVDDFLVKKWFWLKIIFRLLKIIF